MHPLYLVLGISFLGVVHPEGEYTRQYYQLSVSSRLRGVKRTGTYEVSMPKVVAPEMSTPSDLLILFYACFSVFEYSGKLPKLHPELGCLGSATGDHARRQMTGQKRNYDYARALCSMVV